MCSERSTTRENGRDERLQVRDQGGARRRRSRRAPGTRGSFVSTSGPSVASRTSDQTSQPSAKSCSAVCGAPAAASADPGDGDHERAHPRGRVALHERRDGDRVAGPGRRGGDAEQDTASGRRRPRRPHRRRRARRRGTRPATRARSGATSVRARARGRSGRRRPASRRGAARSWRRSSVSRAYTNVSWLTKMRSGGDADETGVAAGDAERPLGDDDDPDEDHRGEPVAHGGVGERLEPVREDVARDRQVQRPQDDRHEQGEIAQAASSDTTDGSYL